MGLPQSMLTLAVLALAGCSSTPPDPVPPPTDGGNFHAYISNQSFDDPTADLRITLDGLVLFDGEAKVEGQHNWMLREATLDAGSHTIDAFETETGARASKSFTLPAGQERWAVVDFWNEDGQAASFTITIHEEQVYFA